MTLPLEGKKKPEYHHRLLSIFQREYVLVGIIALLAIIIRTIYIFLFPSFGYDESTYLFIAKQISQGYNAYIDFPLFTSPLYPYVLSAFLSVFGFGEFQARFFSCLMGGITTALLYLIGKEIGSKRLSLFFSLLYASSSFLIHMDSINIIEPFLAVIIAASVLTLLKWKNSQKDSWLLAAGVLTGVGLFTKTSAIVIITSFSMLIVIWKGWKQFLKLLIIQLSTVVILFSPFLLMNLRNTILNVFGYTLVRNQSTMGLLGSVKYIMFTDGDAGLTLIGFASILFIAIKILPDFKKHGRLVFQRMDWLFIIPPLSFLLAFILINFYYPYLLHPLYIFLVMSSGYLLDYILETFFGHKDNKLFVRVEKRVLYLVLVVLLISSFAFEVGSMAEFTATAQEDRTESDRLVKLIHNITAPTDIILSTSPSISTQLQRKLSLFPKPFEGLDFLNSMRFKTYCRNMTNKTIMDALLFRGDLNSIEVENYNQTIIPLMKSSDVIVIDDTFIDYAPKYNTTIKKWLYRNTYPINTGTDEYYQVYKTLEKGTNTTLWNGLNASWTNVEKQKDNTILSQNNGMLRIDSNSFNQDYDWYKCDLENYSILITKENFLKIRYKTDDYTDGMSLNCLLTFPNSTVKGFDVASLPPQDDGVCYFNLYELFKSLNLKAGTKISTFYIGIKKSQTPPQVKHYSVYFYELYFFQMNKKNTPE